MGDVLSMQHGRLRRLAQLYVDPAQIMIAAAMRPDPWQKDLLRGFPKGGRSGTLVGGSGSLKRCLLVAGRQEGKALAVDTPVPTPDGWTVMGKLAAGDTVLDEQGRPTVVTVAHPMSVTDCWRVTFCDGTSLDASGDHEWTVLDRLTRRAMRRKHPDAPLTDWASWEYPRRDRHGNPHGPAFAPMTVTTRQLAAAGVRHRREWRWAIPTTQPLELPSADLPVDPWCLGYWYGNGTKLAGAVTAHCEDADLVADRYRQAGHTVSTVVDRTDRCAVRVNIRGLLPQLRRLGILGTRHVPVLYLRAHPAQRLALLQGLMDSDGSGMYDRPRSSNVEWSTTDPELRDAFLDLAHGLGFRPHTIERRARLDGKDCGPYWRISFTPHLNPFMLPRKAAHWTSDPDQGARMFGRTVRGIKSITRLPDQPTRCITVANPTGLYLAGEAMIPTHNSSTVGALCAHRLLTDPGPHGHGCLVLAVAPSQRTAIELVSKVRGYLRALEVPLEQDAATSLTIGAGINSRIVALPGTPTSARGWSAVSLVAIDEAAYVAEETYLALRPTLIASGGDLICLTSAGQEGTWAHRIWTKAPGWTKVEVPWWKCPRFADNPDEINELKASMPAAVFTSEMECRWGAAGIGIFDSASVSAALYDAGLPGVPVITPYAQRAVV
ncbi:hypothetical protein [Streptomyces sp. cg36]|uniref:hypothetical protein n=1 Tax=Streptomyces sp. cg36 TaxID=3238798 RepID=UPI0034E2E162